ncbi:MAG TPA: hypothetical protein VMJ66_10310 [Geobacteraceae bacterium]|nr:hypothetical protein [Geobacteraceae bacterium]
MYDKKLKPDLEWKLETGFGQLADVMVEASLELAEREKRANG